MDIDQRESIIGLVETDVTGLVRLVIFNAEVGFVGHLDGWGGSGGSGLFCEVFLYQLFLAILVDEGLPVTDEERSHVGDE